MRHPPGEGHRYLTGQTVRSLCRRIATAAPTRAIYILCALIPNILLLWTLLEATRTEGWGGLGIALGFAYTLFASLGVGASGFLLYAAGGQRWVYLGFGRLSLIPAVFIGFKLLANLLD